MTKEDSSKSSPSREDSKQQQQRESSSSQNQPEVDSKETAGRDNIALLELQGVVSQLSEELQALRRENRELAASVAAGGFATPAESSTPPKRVYLDLSAPELVDEAFTVRIPKGSVPPRLLDLHLEKVYAALVGTKQTAKAGEYRVIYSVLIYFTAITASLREDLAELVYS